MVCARKKKHLWSTVKSCRDAIWGWCFWSSSWFLECRCIYYDIYCFTRTSSYDSKHVQDCWGTHASCFSCFCSCNCWAGTVNIWRSSRRYGCPGNWFCPDCIWFYPRNHGSCISGPSFDNTCKYSLYSFLWWIQIFSWNSEGGDARLWWHSCNGGLGRY